MTSRGCGTPRSRSLVDRSAGRETADEVAAAIAFLASDDAAYITGEALNVSGGQTMV